jgi:hypothetical protein
MSIGLSAAELTAIRDDIADLMPDTCTIQQVAYANDAIGQPARSFSNRATGVSCRLDPVDSVTLTGNETVSSIKNYLITEGMFVLTLPHDQTIDEQDRVIHGGITYEVVHVDDDKSWQASVRCVLKTITPSN